MPDALLITQCLQNDFVQPLGRYDELPNTLHVGHDEALRLMGPDPAHGPVAATMRWALRQPDDELAMIHIRDWHDPNDPGQASHLELFGEHCLHDTAGARLVFEDWPDEKAANKRPVVIDGMTLNDFKGTQLAEVLGAWQGQSLRVGIIGVWTEAKVTFLAYELATRFPSFRLGVCSALTASSSRANHFLALDQLEKLLNVEIFPSVGAFIRFLGGEAEELVLPGLADQKHPELSVSDDANIGDTDLRLLRYLFRDSRTARFKVLAGGYSGNLVLGSTSESLEGIEQVPHVVKIGEQDLIGRERARFERIESVLGNAAPSITAFADLGDRGAIKYRYASMAGGFANTFQRKYVAGLTREKTQHYTKVVFEDLLGRFYAAATLEKADLLEHYWFSPDFAPGVRRRVEALVGPAAGDEITIGQRRVYNLCRFYEQDLAALPRNFSDTCFMSYVHGDLNGANIIIDDQDNVWLIDFFHTQPGHVLKDLIKLENDLLYIFTPVKDAAELEEACRLSDLLLAVQDLAAPLPPAQETGLTHPELLRAYETVCDLRAIYPPLINTDRSPLQVFIGMLRYAAHTLSFYESNEWQKRWALYTAARCAETITRVMHQRGPLRVDWLDAAHTGPGRLGITLLPGRRDYNRDLTEDLAALREAGVTDVVTLVQQSELDNHGVPDLPAAMRGAGFGHRWLPIVDQGTPSREQMRELAAWLETKLSAGAAVLLHCVGGLGRSGTVAACFLQTRGLTAEAAIAEVRRARSPRAVESLLQETYVRTFG